MNATLNIAQASMQNSVIGLSHFTTKRWRSSPCEGTSANRANCHQKRLSVCTRQIGAVLSPPHSDYPPLIGMWVLPVFRKPLRAGSRKRLNLHDGKRAGRVFRKEVFLESPSRGYSTDQGKKSPPRDQLAFDARSPASRVTAERMMAAGRRTTLVIWARSKTRTALWYAHARDARAT